MPFYTVKKDITKIKADIIVNAANRELREGGGVCGAIFAAAGAEELRAACDALAPIRTGKAVVTPGFASKAKYIIHTAGPVYSGKKEDEKLLYSCYIESLKLAEEKGVKNIAFPLISSGIYGYPVKEAYKVAKRAILDFLKKSDLTVYMTLYGTTLPPPSAELRSFLETHLADCAAIGSVISEDASSLSMTEMISRLDEPFSKTLFRMIDERNMTDPEVYKAANIDRRHFSKIRNVKNYTPKKKTILALAVALKLDINETELLLERAGYTLSRSRLFDVILRYFITHKQYDIWKINEALYHYDQVELGG